jgi:hypothetical protein
MFVECLIEVITKSTTQELLALGEGLQRNSMFIQEIGAGWSLKCIFPFC